jgi:hypothetical protein
VRDYSFGQPATGLADQTRSIHGLIVSPRRTGGARQGDSGGRLAVQPAAAVAGLAHLADFVNTPAEPVPGQ